MSVSRSMMTIKNRNYWKSARAVRKNRYNNTPVVDGIHGNSKIVLCMTICFIRIICTVVVNININILVQ